MLKFGNKYSTLQLYTYISILSVKIGRLELMPANEAAHVFQIDIIFF